MKKFDEINDNKEFQIEDKEQNKRLTVFVNAQDKLSMILVDKYGQATIDFTLSELEELNIRMQNVLEHNKQRISSF